MTLSIKCGSRASIYIYKKGAGNRNKQLDIGW